MGAPDQDLLQGTWHFAELQVDGSTVPAALIRTSRMIIDGSGFSMLSPEAVYKGHYVLRPDAIPREIDIHFTEGPEAGNTSLGIYRVDGDCWTICLGLTGRPRPSTFETRPGSGFALESLRRGEPEAATYVDPDAASPLASSPHDAPSDPELARLQGEWRLVSGILNGQPLEPQWAQGMRRIAQGNALTVSVCGQTIIQAEVHLLPGTEPAAIDYQLLVRGKRGQCQHGIFRWDGDEVTFCMAEPGRDRPREFASEPGSGRTLTRWRHA